MKEWNYFFATSASASGGLIGLIFVAVSVSHSRVLNSRTLPIRAMIAIAFLFNILEKALIFLIPGQKSSSVAIEIGIGTLIFTVIVEMLEIMIIKRIEAKLRRRQIIGFILAQIALLPFVVCSYDLLYHKEDAVYWIVPGIILSFLKVIIDAWVLLIEANR